MLAKAALTVVRASCGGPCKLSVADVAETWLPEQVECVRCCFRRSGRCCCRYAYPIRCTSYSKDAAGNVTEVSAEYEADYTGKKPPKVLIRTHQLPHPPDPPWAPPILDHRCMHLQQHTCSAMYRVRSGCDLSNLFSCMEQRGQEI